MGRSKETFSKKEKEKKKRKKKQLKAERREAKKEQDSASFEEMLAYVDADGNIVDTPPDPVKKDKEINAEDIIIGIPPKEETDPTEGTRKGTVSFFNDEKGYGFIKDHESQEDVFVHVNGLKDEIMEKDKVSFEVEQTPKGLSAFNVKRI